MRTIDDVPAITDRRYQDFTVGEHWGPFSDELDQGSSDALRGAVGAGRSGEAAPLGVLPMLTLRALRRALQGIVPGGVLIRQSFTVVDRLPSAGWVDVAVTLTAQQQRPSGFYSTFAFTLSHDDNVVAVVEWMILAPPEADA